MFQHPLSLPQSSSQCGAQIMNLLEVTTNHVVSIDDAIKGILGPQNDHVLTDSTIELYKKQNPWPTHSYNFKWRENRRKDE